MDALLESLERMFDYIIIDTPPVNIVTDAMVVAGHKTSILFVVRENDSLHSEFKESLRNLEMANLDILGVVVNDASYDPKGGRYGRYRRYGRYSRYGRYGKYKYGYKYGYGYGYGGHEDIDYPTRKKKAKKKKIEASEQK